MKSSNFSLLDDKRLEDELQWNWNPTSEETAALRCPLPSMSLEDYFHFLASFGHASSATLRARKGPQGSERFEL